MNPDGHQVLQWVASDGGIGLCPAVEEAGPGAAQGCLGCHNKGTGTRNVGGEQDQGGMVEGSFDRGWKGWWGSD